MKKYVKVIDSVIVFNCKILNLEQPTVKYEPSDKFATPTTKAGINPESITRKQSNILCNAI